MKRILFLLAFLMIVAGSIFGWQKYYDYYKKDFYSQNKYNENPVYQDHLDEFDIKKSYYIDDNYERYIAYRKKHPNYSDDTVINYVNIGLDNPFYTNMQKTDMSDGLLVLCNKYHTLEKNYVPNLVSLAGYGGGQLQPEAAKYFKKMVDDAKKDGIKLWNVSAYRSYNTQKNLYNNYVNRDGVAKADTYSARPGSSEHQTGLATDINTASSGAHFDKTNEYGWLIKNSYKYGFILRYPDGKTFITGYKYEPWHYRYVGKEAAKIIYDEKLTYEEYYVIYMLRKKGA